MENIEDAPRISLNALSIADLSTENPKISLPKINLRLSRIAIFKYSILHIIY